MGKKLAPKLRPSQRKLWLEILQPAVVKVENGSRSSESYRIVVDTNILISAVLYGGKPERVLRYVLQKHQLVLSDYIIEEFVSYLKSVHPRVSQKWLRHMRQRLEAYSYEDGTDIDDEVRDINDTAILQLAICQQACILTGDSDLLEHKAHSAVAIISITEFGEIFPL